MTFWGIALLVCLAVVVLGTGIQGLSGFLGFLAETWLIQTAVAAWVAFRLQEISQVNQRRFERLQTTYERKIEAVQTLYGRIEKRLYATRRYLSVIISEPDLIASEREQYREVVRDWNENIKLSQATLLVEFRAGFGLSLDHVFFPEFSKTDARLRTLRQQVEAGNEPNSSVVSAINTTLRNLNQYSLDLIREMLQEARRDRHVMDDTLDVTEENAPQLSYGRVLKALVEPLP